MKSSSFKSRHIAIEKEFIKEFKSMGMSLSKDMIATVEETCVTIGLELEPNRMAFGSDVVIYAKRYYRNENSINFGSSGKFNPSDQASYWRTIHASEILKNWNKVSDIVNKYCQKVEELNHLSREL